MYFKYNCLLFTCTSSTIFVEYFYFYLSSFFMSYLYFYSSTSIQYFYQLCNTIWHKPARLFSKWHVHCLSDITMQDCGKMSSVSDVVTSSVFVYSTHLKKTKAKGYSCNDHKLCLHELSHFIVASLRKNEHSIREL